MEMRTRLRALPLGYRVLAGVLLVLLMVAAMELAVRGYFLLVVGHTLPLRPDLYSLDDDHSPMLRPLVNPAGNYRMVRPDETVPPGKKYVLCVGDSQAFGIFCPTSYPHEMQKLLSGTPYHVINYAMPGLGAAAAVARVREGLAKFRPGVVLLCLGWNDYSRPKTIPGRVLAKIPEMDITLVESAPRYLYQHLYLYKAWRVLLYGSREYELKPVSLGAGSDTGMLARYPACLGEIVDLCRGAGARLVMATQPSLLGRRMTLLQLKIAERLIMFDDLDRVYGMHERYNEEIRRIAASRGVPCCDLDALFQGERKERYFSDEIHLNVQGSRLLARRLAAFLRQAKLLEEEK